MFAISWVGGMTVLTKKYAKTGMLSFASIVCNLAKIHII